MKLKVLSTCIILCSVLIEVYTMKQVPQEMLDVKEFGVINTNIGSIAIVFYLVVYNPRPSLAPLEITEDKCCIEEDDKPFFKRQDCTVMKIYGGYVGTISAQHTKNVTFIYPTPYPYDMVGNCIVLLKTETFTQVIKIPFDTTLYEKPVSWIPVGVNAYLFSSSVPKKCQSRDEDRFNGCSPVMCDLKYHGHRNHFDRRTKQCTVRRECPGSDLHPPVTVYDNRTNSCRNLSQSIIITEEEKKLLSQPQEVKGFETVNWKIERRLDCNYGRIAPNRSTCICSTGWQSLVLPYQDVDPITGLLQMCNQGRKSYWKHYVVGVVFIVIGVTWIYISFYLFLRDKQKKRYREKSSEFSPAKGGPFHKLHEQFSPKDDEYERMSMMGRLCYNLCCKLQPKEKYLDESIEYERKSRMTRWSRNALRKLQPNENKLDCSVEGIRASRLSPPSLAMGTDLEINLR